MKASIEILEMEQELITDSCSMRVQVKMGNISHCITIPISESQYDRLNDTFDNVREMHARFGDRDGFFCIGWDDGVTREVQGCAGTD